MEISFHGAARTVTGSKHIIHLNSGKKILLDCGMFQGMGKDTLLLNAEWGFDPAAISYVIISHAHIDHIGLLPKLVKDGYKGKIFCTTPTAALMEILLRDSAHIQEADVRYVNKKRKEQGRELVAPLYTEDDALKVFTLLHTLQYNEVHTVDDNIQLQYTDCGHILGSAAVNLVVRENGKETRISFSGDIGKYKDIILRSPDRFPQADYIIMESTYGDKLHEDVDTPVDVLLKYVTDTCVKRKGKLVIPAFSVGRTQELLYVLNRLEVEGRLPKVNYYVDSPLSILATEVIKKHPECFNAHVQELLRNDDDVFSFAGLQYIRELNDSKRLNVSQEPCVIISASGMAEAGRVKHHIAHAIGDSRNTILMVGYCEPRSLGGRLRSGAKEVSIFGKEYDVKAQVGYINSMSAHGDYEDMIQWLSCQDKQQVRKVFLVHGEYEVQQNFSGHLVKNGFAHVDIPAQHEVIALQ